MLVTEINSMNFEGGWSQVGKTKSKPTFASLHGLDLEQLTSIVDGFNKLFPSLKALSIQKSSKNAQQILAEMGEKVGLRSVGSAPEEGIVIGHKTKNILISTHGKNSLRIREQDAKTGKITSSFFVKDKNLVKSDTRVDIPAELEYYTEGELTPEQIQRNAIEQLLKVDRPIARLRVIANRPDVQAEVAKSDPRNMISEINRSMLVRRPNS